MSWSNHTHSIATKARQKLGFLRRNPKGSPLDCKKLANVALVKSSQVFVYLTGMSECRPVHRTMLHNKNSNVRIKQYSNGISLECDEL